MIILDLCTFNRLPHKTRCFMCCMILILAKSDVAKCGRPTRILVLLRLFNVHIVFVKLDLSRFNFRVT